MVRRRVMMLAAVSILGPQTARVMAQLMTADSQADLYIADVVDGGPASSRWTNQFRFVNTGALTGAPANGTIYFYADDGSPMPVDFGAGASSVFTVSVPVSGAVRLETTGSSLTVRQGFVHMIFDSPVQVTAEFRNWQNATVKNGASVNATTPSDIFWYSADAYTGIAVANPNSFAVTCVGIFLDTQGNMLASNSTISLGPLAHTAFTLGSYLSLQPTALGSFQFNCNKGNLGAVAPVVTLAIAGTSGGITSSLPNSATSAPIYHREDLEKAFSYLTKLIRTSSDLSQYAPFIGQPQLVIATDNSILNACAETPQSNFPCNGPTGTVKVWLSLAELLADSPSEIAFALGHELGHVVQRNMGNQVSFQMIFPVTTTNQTFETDADIFGLIVAIEGGYDAYGVAGVLGKLMMVTGSATINAQYEENMQAFLGTDMHTSFLNRLTNLYTLIQATCQSLPATCQNYKQYFHPDFPGFIPLSRPRP